MVAALPLDSHRQTLKQIAVDSLASSLNYDLPAKVLSGS